MDVSSEFKNVAEAQCALKYSALASDVARWFNTLKAIVSRAFKASVYSEVTLRQEYREFVEIPNAVTFLAYLTEGK